MTFLGMVIKMLPLFWPRAFRLTFWVLNFIRCGEAEYWHSLDCLICGSLSFNPVGINSNMWFKNIITWSLKMLQYQPHDIFMQALWLLFGWQFLYAQLLMNYKPNTKDVKFLQFLWSRLVGQRKLGHQHIQKIKLNVFNTYLSDVSLNWHTPFFIMYLTYY